MKTTTNHGGKRPGAGRRKGSKNPNAGRKLGSLNDLTLRLHREQQRTREDGVRLRMRVVVGQGRIRNRKLAPHEAIQLLKQAAKMSSQPLGYVTVDAGKWNAMLEKARAATQRDPKLRADLPRLYQLAGAVTTPEQGAVRAAVGL